MKGIATIGKCPVFQFISVFASPAVIFFIAIRGMHAKTAFTFPIGRKSVSNLASRANDAATMLSVGRPVRYRPTILLAGPGLLVKKRVIA